MLKRFLIPHKHNDYQPHIFRSIGISALVVVFAVGFGVTVFQQIVLKQTDYLAAVVSSVLVDLANVDRGQSSLGTLTINPLLVAAAQAKADDMATKGYFAHNSPEGLTPWHWFGVAGYRYAFAGENLAVDFSDSAEVDRAWMNSPLHRANILNANYTEVGIATAQGTYQGRPTTFVVQMFGKPSVNPQFAAVEAVETPARTLTPTPVPAPAAVALDASSASNFVSTSNAVTVLGDEDQATSSVLGESVPEPKKYSGGADKLLTSPSRTMNLLLIILATIISFSLILIISVEAKRRHMKSMYTGIIALVVVVALCYYFRTFFFAGVTIG